MSIQGWILLFNAAITALILVGGVWLRSVVNQQLRSKDSSIQALESASKQLEAALKSKDAEICALKAASAPAIAKDYETMLKHADSVTEEKHALLKQVKDLNDAHSRVLGILPAELTLATMDGLLLAQNLFATRIGSILFPKPAKPPEISIDTMMRIIDEFNEAFRLANHLIEQKSKEFESLMEPVRRKVKNSHAR